MRKNRTSTKKKKNDVSYAQKMMRSLLYGFITALVVCIVMLLVFSAILASQDLPLSVVWMFSTITLIVSSFIGGFVAERMYKSRGVVIGAIIGLLIFFALMLVNALTGGEIGWSVALTKLLTGVLSGVIGGIIGLNAKIGKKALK